MSIIKPPTNESLPGEVAGRQIMAFVLASFGGNGYVPHGYLTLQSEGDDGVEYSVHRCFSHDSGETWGLESGVWGLETYAKAWERLKGRVE